MPPPPTLTAEQRAKGLELRRERRLVVAVLKEDWTDLESVWSKGAVQGMKVVKLLRALPGIGPYKAKLLLEQAGIPEKNTVRRTGHRQRQRLFELLAERSPGK